MHKCGSVHGVSLSELLKSLVYFFYGENLIFSPKLLEAIYLYLANLFCHKSLSSFILKSLVLQQVFGEIYRNKTINLS